VAENRSIFFIGIKELIGNLTPAYLIVLIGLYFTNKFTDPSTAMSYLFFAGLIAVGMSAIQPYFLRLILRPNSYLQLLTEPSVDKILTKEVDKSSKKSKKEKKEERINILKTKKNFNKSYLSYLKLSIEEFWERRERLRGAERQFYEIKEGRLFLFLYLFILFSILTLISLFQNWSGQYFLKKMELISITNPEIINYSIIGFGFLSVIFCLGFYHEFIRYREIIFEEIPVIAATKQKNDVDSIKRKIGFLNESKNNMSESAFNQLQQELEKKLDHIQSINFKKDWIVSRVHKETEISKEEIQEISKDISERISKTSFYSLTRASLLITTITFLSLFFYTQFFIGGRVFISESISLVALILFILLILSGLLLFSKFRFLLFNSLTRMLLLLTSIITVLFVLNITFFTKTDIFFMAADISIISLLGIISMLVILLLIILRTIFR